MSEQTEPGIINPDVEMIMCVDGVMRPRHRVIYGEDDVMIKHPDGVDRPGMRTSNGGKLMVGNYGHNGSKAGRPAEMVKLKATDGCLEEIGALVEMMGMLRDKAQALMLAGNVGGANGAIDRMVKIFATLANVGMGQNITTTVDSTQTIDKAIEVATKIYGKNELLVKFIEELQDAHKA